jgi:hypothetical protein
MRAELLRIRQELWEKDATITSLQRSVAEAVKPGRVPDFLSEKAIKVKSLQKHATFQIFLVSAQDFFLSFLLYARPCYPSYPRDTIWPDIPLF